MPPIRALIIDDDPELCNLIQLQLERAKINVVGMRHDGAHALDAVVELSPSMLLLDISMPKMDGLQALRAVKSRYPSVSVIILTAHKRQELLARAIAQGAAAYLVKTEIDLDTLPRMLETLSAGGEAIVEPTLLRDAFRMIDPSIVGPESERLELLGNLTDQERRILELMGEGHTNDEIANHLYVSYNTIKSHVQNIFKKLGVSDRTQAALFALRSGMVRNEA